MNRLLLIFVDGVGLAEDGLLAHAAAAGHSVTFANPFHRRHTRNPVPLLAVGPRARRFAALRQLTEVAPRILAELGVEEADAEPAQESRSR